MIEKKQKANEKIGIAVFSLNLRFGLAEDGENAWEYRKKGYPELLDSYHSDFMAFQEVNDFQGDFIRDHLSGHSVIGKREPAPDYWQNNLVFFKKDWNCIRWKHFFLSDTPETFSRFPDSKWPRQCTMGLFEKDSVRLIFINTHFDFKEQVQVKSARVIMRMLYEFPSEIPAVLVGDFNCSPYGPCMQVFTGKEAKPAYCSAPFFKKVFPKPYPGTFHGFTGEQGEEQIDWILYRGEIFPKKWGVVPGKFSGVYPSDHFPLYAFFECPKELTIG